MNSVPSKTLSILLSCSQGRPFGWLTAVLLLSAAAFEVSAADRLQITGQTMGTYFAVTIDSPDDSETEAGLLAEIETRLNEINAQMSTWDEESEISAFNRSATQDWFEVSSEFAGVVREAKRIHELTAGAFDPTVSPLIDLWGFGSSGRTGIPDQSAIDQALQAVGMQHIEVRLDPPALRRTHPGVQLNLSAIAKGYAVDAIAELLTTSGRPSFIVDIGGESRAGVEKAAGEPWRVGVESANAGLSRDPAPGRVLPITRSSIATSGDYRNFYEIDGVTYSHTIDPVTGHPVPNPPASVSVVHDSCMTADALATAFMVLGVERGRRLAEEQQLSVLFQLIDGEGRIRVQGTGQFGTEEQKSSGTWMVFVAAGVLFLVAVGGMAIGVMVSNREIKGSCGGLASMPGSEGRSICELCSIPRDECVNEQLRQQMAAGQSDCAADAECVDAQCSDVDCSDAALAGRSGAADQAETVPGDGH